MENKLYTTTVALLTFTIAMTAFYWQDWKQPQLVNAPRPKTFRNFDVRKIDKRLHRIDSIPVSQSGSPVPSKNEGSVHNRQWKNATENTTSSLRHENDTPKTNCVKQIQLLSSFSFDFPEKEYECPEINCKARYIYSNSYQKLTTSHAAILHHKGKWRLEDLERNRPNGQVWIYMTKESPIHSRRLSTAVYNWSMTYHIGSEVTIPYGQYFERTTEIPVNGDRNWAAGKTRLVAWMASNCGVTSWGRSKFVRKLQTYIQVDTYGACGQLKCPRNSEDCDRILSAHKFYLALENSECDDYITEKFWRNGLSQDMVPIVYGTTRDHYERVAPPHSFIHVSDFKNMTHLADYIKYLDSNDTAYNEYFEWKKSGYVEYYNQRQAHSPKDLLCGIVKKLKENQERSSKGNALKPDILDIQNWWRASCHHRKSIWSP